MIPFGIAVAVILVVLCVAQLIATPPPQQRTYVPPPAPPKTTPQPKFATVLYEYRVTKQKPTPTPWRDTP